MAALAVFGLLVTGCSNASDKGAAGGPHPSVPGLVLYGIGVSTDPYGSSAQLGFGVVSRLGEGDSANVEVRGDSWCPERASWLSSGRLLVPERGPRGACTRQVIFRYDAGRLVRVGVLALGKAASAWAFALSPDEKLVADEPSVPCCSGGQRPAGIIFVARADGSRRHEVARGHLAGWAPDGRLLSSTGLLYDLIPGDFLALDLASGRTELVLSSRRVARRAGVPKAEVGSPVWSSDRRFYAARTVLTRPEARRPLSAVVIAEGDGKIIQLLRSRYEISMLAWSATGRRLAYTTSGFPAPHEVFVVDRPDAQPRRIFTTTRHFDWITWSPIGRWLLLDDEHAGKWQLFDASAGTVRALPRLGGRPLWCCPQNKFSGR